MAWKRNKALARTLNGAISMAYEGIMLKVKGAYYPYSCRYVAQRIQLCNLMTPRLEDFALQKSQGGIRGYFTLKLIFAEYDFGMTQLFRKAT